MSSLVLTIYTAAILPQFVFSVEGAYLASCELEHYPLIWRCRWC